MTCWFFGIAFAWFYLIVLLQSVFIFVILLIMFVCRVVYCGFCFVFLSCVLGLVWLCLWLCLCLCLDFVSFWFGLLEVFRCLIEGFGFGVYCLLFCDLIGVFVVLIWYFGDLSCRLICFLGVVCCLLGFVVLIYFYVV